MTVTNILDFIYGGKEEVLKQIVSSFECHKNPEIEEFIHQKAIEFAHRKLSITYLVTDDFDDELLGYFTLTHKSIVVDAANLSKTSEKKLARYSRKDAKTGNYMASAFLLAQFGKNYAVDDGNRISGSELLSLADAVLIDIQYRIGGGIIYLDCEDHDKIISFYSGQNFKRFDDRFDEDENKEYIQFMRFF